MAKAKVAIYTAPEAARKLGVSPTTVYRWLDEGDLEEFFGVAGGNRRYVTAASVERMAQHERGKR